MNNVSFVGRLTSKPELKFLQNGTAISKFNIAIPKELNKSQKKEFSDANKPLADFPRIVTWGKQAEVCCEYLDKGSLVGIVGSVITNSFENSNGITVYTTEFRASKVKFLDSSKKENTNDLLENEIPF